MTATSYPHGITSDPACSRCGGPTAGGRCISCHGRQRGWRWLLALVRALVAREARP